VLQSTYARPDALFRAQLEFWRWLVEVAPSERAFFEAFFTWVYTPRAHADGSLSQIIEETLAFTYQQSVDAFQAQVDALMGHDTTDRLSEIAVRTLVIAGEFDIIFPARFGRLVASSPRRRKHPTRGVRPLARRGPPALPGSTRNMERTRGCFLALG
jgi:pimeloyl-ACP methyl ester carboxylesterase